MKYTAYRQDSYGHPVTAERSFEGTEEAAKFFGVGESWIITVCSPTGLNAVKKKKGKTWLIFRESTSLEYRESMLGIHLDSNTTFVADDIIKEIEED